MIAPGYSTSRALPASAPEALARVGVKAVLAIFRAWGLTDEEAALLLGDVGVSTVRRWRAQLERGALRLDARRDLLDRLSLLLGIYKALHILFPDPQQADRWIRRPNLAAPFHGQSALEWMREGGLQQLWTLRRYLDAQRG